MWPINEQTQELIDAAKAGRPDAAGQLLNRHRDALRRMVELRLDRRIQQRIDASDIVQEVMIEANRRLEQYLATPAMPFHLWLRQMARDRIIDAHRRHRASGKRSVDREQAMAAPASLDRSTMELAGQLCDPELTPAAAATMQELQRRFQAALETMEDHDREIVLMRHFEQLSNQDAARTLGLTEPAASMRYLRAIRKLRKLLAEPSDEDGGSMLP
jgi:RNA polymerase sigma-70 factor (ECF subfamily)